MNRGSPDSHHNEYSNHKQTIPHMVTAVSARTAGRELNRNSAKQRLAWTKNSLTHGPPSDGRDGRSTDWFAS